MGKKNCWEFMNCGRQPGGEKAHEQGVCPAAIDDEYDGTNQGEKAGRACWAIAGTLCGGKAQGTFAAKIETCLNCDFYKKVKDEEEKGFIILKRGRRGHPS